MARFFITQIRHFVVDAETNEGAAELFEDAFEDYNEDEFEVADPVLVVKDMGSIH